MVSRMEGTTGGSLADVIDRILDKGLVINADITVSVVGVELLGIKIRAAVASFETAARYGLEFPSGTRTEASAWAGAPVSREGTERAPGRANGAWPHGVSSVEGT